MPRREREVFVSVSMMVTEIHPERSWAQAGCPRCRGSLELLQPDAAQPYRLLGVCEDCSAWVVAEVTLDADKVSLAALPMRLPES